MPEVAAEANLAETFDADRPEKSLTAWIAETAPRALAYARSLVGNAADAEDLVADCYGRLLAKSHEYDLAASGTKLLFKAVTNACINWGQRRPPEVSWENCEVGGSGVAENRETQPDRRAMQRELESAVAAGLMELPVNQRAVIELRSLGHSMNEVAEMMGVSPENARVMLHRARRTLAVLLRPYLEGEEVT